MVESVAIGVSACLRLVLLLHDLEKGWFLLQISWLDPKKQFPRWFFFRSMTGLFQLHTNIEGGGGVRGQFMQIHASSSTKHLLQNVISGIYLGWR